MLRAGVAPAWWRLDRFGKRVRLLVSLVGGAPEAERFDGACGGRTEDAEAAQALQTERVPAPDAAHASEPLQAVLACRVSSLGQAVRGLKKLEVWDLRPEGVTVYGPGAARIDPGWPDLAATFTQAVGG